MVSDSPDEAVEQQEHGSFAVATILVGGIMIGIFLIVAVIKVFEELLLDALFPCTGQFVFLCSIFPSQAYYDVLSWQNVLVFEVIPFLLFFYFAVRTDLDPLRRDAFKPVVIVVLAVVGAILEIIYSALNSYQDNISHLLLSGSPAIPPDLQTESFVTFITSFGTPLDALSLAGAAAQFVFLGLSGIAVGYFAGEAPLWTLRRRWYGSKLEREDHHDESKDEESLPGSSQADPTMNSSQEEVP